MSLRPIPIRPTLGPILFVLAVAGGGAMAGCAPDAHRPAVAVAAGTGFAVAARLGIEAALEAHPGLVLDTLFRVEGAESATAALEIAEGLVRHPGLVAVIGHANSSSSLAASPIYHAGGVLQLAPTVSSPLFAEAGPLAFSLVPPDDRQGRLLASLLHERVGTGGRIALLYVNDDYGRELRSSLREGLDLLGLEVVLDLPHEERRPEEEEVLAAVGLVERAAPDAIAFLGRGRVLDALLPGIRERLGYVPVIGPDGVGTSGRSAAPEERGPAWTAVEYLDFLPLPSGEVFEAFRTRFRAATDGAEPTSTSVMAHDAAWVVVEGVAAGARTGDELANWLRGLDGSEPWMSALLGGPIVFDPGGSVDRPYVLLEMRPRGPALLPVGDGDDPP